MSASADQHHTEAASKLPPKHPNDERSKDAEEDQEWHAHRRERPRKEYGHDHRDCVGKTTRGEPAHAHPQRPMQMAMCSDEGARLVCGEAQAVCAGERLHGDGRSRIAEQLAHNQRGNYADANESSR